MSRSFQITSALTVLIAVLTQQTTAIHPPAQQCRCFPSDECWPSQNDWQTFNRTLHGKLVATVPLAAPCHQSPFAEYNASKCQALQETWTLPQEHYDSSSSIMAPFFANRSCDPFTGKEAQCVLGTYVQYAVNISSAGDVAKTLTFARRRNIRTVIRNTGHDYNGKSTGAGALGVWTHHLKDIHIFDYSSSQYSGKALRMEAGVQAFEAYAAAHEQNLAVIGGECPTVGLAGGYTQGGGHSMLGSKYGLGADQVLEWEVVDGTGRHLNATREKNADLYWALSGGGGGTYGIVLSLTVKARPDMPTSGFNLTFNSDGISQDTYWDLIGAWHQALPAIVDAGVTGLTTFDNRTFSISTLTGQGISKDKMQELVTPFLNTLDKAGIKPTTMLILSPSYFSHYYNFLQTSVIFPVAVGIAQYGGRLITRSTVLHNNTALTDAYRKIVNMGGGITTVDINVPLSVAGDVYNAVNPAWRENLLDTLVSTNWNFTAPWSDMVADADKITNEFLPLLEAVSPGGGTYINEADPNDPNWKLNYYGANYDRLESIKNKYDPYHLFYALTAVGSDYWDPQPDGRLCKAK